MNPISGGLAWKFQKNRHLLAALLLRNAPRFVYQSHPEKLVGEIPVFTFHTALPDWFEEQCRHLAANGYRTLTADEFLAALDHPARCPERSVLLTFDDGIKHVWTVAYPLLKKYGLKATCFLIPGCIPPDDHRIRPTLEDFWRGQASQSDILSLRDGCPLATWDEIRLMHASGVVDFQSHTLHHSLVFTSGDIFDFIHPHYDAHFYGNIHVPLYMEGGQEVYSRTPVLGMPIYRAAPRMSAARRFFDDETVRAACVARVAKEGPASFFARSGWRSILRALVREVRSTGGLRESYETAAERNRSIHAELVASREAIEARLPGKDVRHLCYPWYEAGDFAMEASRRAGFRANYFGQLPGRPSNRPGDDPYRIVRVEDVFLQRLPGQGRFGMADLLRKLRELHGFTPGGGLRGGEVPS
jgi:hypothetical protein